MPAAASTPVQALTESKMLLPTESPKGKKLCFQELIAAWLSKSAPPLCLKLDYSDIELLGYTWSPLINVIPWIKYKAQNMMEPTWRQEVQCIRETDHIQYIVAMLVWFCQWRQEHGSWPSLPACGFQVGALSMATIKTRVMSVITEIKMTLGRGKPCRS